MIFSEAYRNLRSGTAPWLLVVPLLTVAAIAFAGLRMGDARRIIEEDGERRAAGVNDVRVVGVVDGDRCDSAEIGERYAGSGAVRQAGTIALPLGVAQGTPLLEITPGMARLVQLEPDVSGVYISEAARPQAAKAESVTIDGEPTPIAGFFTATTLLSDRSAVVVSVVASRGEFDSCVVKRTVPYEEDYGDLSRIVRPGSLDSLSIEPIEGSLGSPLNAYAQLVSAPKAFHLFGAAGSGFLIALAGVYRRRREISLLAQQGLSRMDQTAILCLEAAGLLTVTLILTFAVLLPLALNEATSDQARYLGALGLGPVVLTVASAMIGTAAGSLVSRRKQVLRYLRDA